MLDTPVTPPIQNETDINKRQKILTKFQVALLYEGQSGDIVIKGVHASFYVNES